MHIISKSKEPQEYTMIYTIDGSPIYLPQGREIYVPSAIQMSFVFEGEKTLPLSFHYFSDQASLVAYANVVEKSSFHEKKIIEQVSEYRFEYKSNIDKMEELIINAESLGQFNNPLVLISLVPKFDYEVDQKQIQNGLQTFQKHNLVRVTAHQGEEKLLPFKEKVVSIQKGDAKYYSIALQDIHNFTLFLLVNTGRVELFMNQGEDNPPSTTKYWKKIVSHHGGEIIVDKKHLKKEEKNFTVAIFAIENSKYSLNFMPEIHNIFSLKYQHLAERSLKKGQTYFFDFYNQKQKFESIFFA